MNAVQIKHPMVALAVVIALIGGPQATAASSSQPAPSPDPTHPVVMQQAGDGVAHGSVQGVQPRLAPARSATSQGTVSLQREVFGFALASSLNDPTVGDPSWDFTLLSTVAFFGLHINDDGTIASDAGLTVWNSSELTDLLTMAHAHGTKVVLTIIEQDFTPGTPHMCAALANRSTVVSQTVAQVSAKGVDGVNIDFEGLNGTCPNGQSARSMMTDLANQMRTALTAGMYLSVDTYASSATDPGGFFDVGGLNPYVDSFFVMAYDLEYSNYKSPPLSCSSLCLGPTAPLAGYYYNDTNDRRPVHRCGPGLKGHPRGALLRPEVVRLRRHAKRNSDRGGRRRYVPGRHKRSRLFAGAARQLCDAPRLQRPSRPGAMGHLVQHDAQLHARAVLGRHGVPGLEIRPREQGRASRRRDLEPELRRRRVRALVHPGRPLRALHICDRLSRAVFATRIRHRDHLHGHGLWLPAPGLPVLDPRSRAELADRSAVLGHADLRLEHHGAARGQLPLHRLGARCEQHRTLVQLPWLQ